MTTHPIRGGIQPAPGRYLLAGIETVLTGSPSDRVRLAEELRAALARTAACGGTCRVRAAADAVRLAAGLLLTGPLDEALDLVGQARAELISGADDREGAGWQENGIPAQVGGGQSEQNLLGLAAQRNAGTVRT
jgi:hypothetical protein